MVGEGCGRCCLTEGVGANHDGSDRAAVHLGPAEAGPWSPRPPRSSSGGPPETSPGVLSKKEVRLWQLHVQCAVKPPHCTSQLFRRKPLFCVETKEPFFSAHKFFCRRGTSQYFQAVAQSTTSLAPLYLVHYDTHFTILWLA